MPITPTSGSLAWRRKLTTRATAIVTLVTMVAALITLAVLPGSPARASTVTVSIKNFSFNPKDITIPVGTTVVWSNDETDGTVHSVTEDTGLFSQDLNPGDKFSWTFDTAGNYGVHCRFHTYITGSVTVTDSSSSSTTSPPSTTPSTTSPPTTSPSTTSPSTTAPPDTTSTTAPGTTSTTAPSSTTTTSTTSTTTPDSTTAPPTTSPPQTTTTTTPSDPSILGGTVIPPLDAAITQLLDGLHSVLVALDKAASGSSG